MPAPFSPVAAPRDPLWSMEDCVRWSRHPDAGVRRWALEKLATCFEGVPEAVVAERLEDPDPEVLQEAVRAAAAQELSALAGPILERYRKGDPLTAPACIHALAALGAPGLLEAIAARVRSATPEERVITWVALLTARVEGCEALMREALEARRAPEPRELAVLLGTLGLAGSPPAQGAAVARLVAEYDRLPRDVVLDTLLIGLGYDGGAGDFQEALEPHGAGEPGRLEAAAASALEEVWEPRDLRAFRKAWRRGRQGEVIALCAETIEGLAGRDDAGVPRRGLPGFVMALGRAPVDRLPGDAQRELAGLAVLATLETLRMARVVLAEIPGAPEEALELLLSGEMADLPELEHRIAEGLLQAPPAPPLVDRCLEVLRQDPLPAGAAPAASLVARWQPAGGVEALLGAWGRDAEGLATDQIVVALTAYGEAALDAIDRYLEVTARPDAAVGLLDVLMDLPCRRSVAILLRHFDRLWRADPDHVLTAAESLGAQELIAPLRRELRDGEDETAQALEFLEVLHGLRAPPRRSAGALAATGEGEDPEAAESFRLALRCPACRRVYHHEVREILVDPGADELDPFIADRIRCKGCGHEGIHEATPQALTHIVVEVDRLLDLREEGAIGPEEDQPGPIRFRAMTAFGRRMNPRQAKAEYEAHIPERPHDPALRVGYGNILTAHHLYDEALAQYREALRLDPLAAEAHAGVARVLESRGDIAGAIQAMERCVEIAPRAHLFRTRDRRGFPEDARQDLDRLRALGSFRPGARRAEPAAAAGGEEEWTPRQASVWERTGRNDPCPCGSGRKYKKCCLGKPRGHTAPSPPLPREAQERLHDRLFAFARQVYPRDVHDQALAAFHGPRWDPTTRTVALNEGEDVLFLDWLAHDFRPEGATETLIQRFQRERGHVLPADERQALDAWLAAAPGLYEVEAVEPGAGLTVVDCFSGERFVVREVRASFQLARWDLAILRLARIQGAWRILKGDYHFPARLKADVMAALGRGLDELRRQRPSATVADLLRARPGLIRDLVQRAYEELPRNVLTPEGHPVVGAKATYEIRDAPDLLAALARAPDFAPDPAGGGAEGRRRFGWLRQGPAERYVKEAGKVAEAGLAFTGQQVDSGGRAVPILGEVEVGAGQRLTVRCLSRERLAWARRRLEDLAGRAIRHRADLFESVQRKLGDPQAAPAEPGPPPPLEEARIVAAFHHQYMRQWLDQAIPALDGKTPRQAAADPAARPRLEQLLRELENMEDRKRAAGQDWHDLSWLRAELGFQ